MFYRKNSFLAAVLSIAFLVAVVSSMTAVFNFVNSQTSTAAQLASVGSKYLLLNKTFPSLTPAGLNPQAADTLNASVLKTCFTQKILTGTLQTSQGQFTVSIRGVNDLPGYLKTLGASINGTAAQNVSETNLGVLLAETCQIRPHDNVTVTVGDVKLTLKTAGVVKSHTQLDSELIIPLQTAHFLSGNNELSLVEFTLKSDVNPQNVLNSISAALPSNVEVVKVQQTSMFLQQSTMETLNFLALWSTTVYVVIAASAYIVSTRLIVDSTYELSILRAVGARKEPLFFWVFSFSMLTALAGSVLGLAAGLAGTQAASTGLRWIMQNLQVTTFLEPVQAGQILFFSIASSAAGCLIPAYRSIRML